MEDLGPAAGIGLELVEDGVDRGQGVRVPGIALRRSGAPSPDGTIVLRPAVVVSAAEAEVLADPS